MYLKFKKKKGKKTLPFSTICMEPENFVLSEKVRQGKKNILCVESNKNQKQNKSKKGNHISVFARVRGRKTHGQKI